MDVKKPIKRSNELVLLSRDHHSGLLLCWKIRTGIKKGIEEERIAAYILFYYRSHLEEHFRQEEEYIFPLVGGQNIRTQKALTEHREIQVLIQKIANNNTIEYSSLEELANKLDAHIRYEERELFPYLEQQADAEQLGNAGGIIAGLHNDIKEPAWSDEFWVRTV